MAENCCTQVALGSILEFLDYENVGRPRLRWDDDDDDDVRPDLGKMKVQNWSKMAMDIRACKKIVEQAESQICIAKRIGRKVRVRGNE